MASARASCRAPARWPTRTRGTSRVQEPSTSGHTSAQRTARGACCQRVDEALLVMWFARGCCVCRLGPRLYLPTLRRPPLSLSAVRLRPHPCLESRDIFLSVEFFGSWIFHFTYPSVATYGNGNRHILAHQDNQNHFLLQISQHFEQKGLGGLALAASWANIFRFEFRKTV